MMRAHRILLLGSALTLGANLPLTGCAETEGEPSLPGDDGAVPDSAAPDTGDDGDDGVDAADGDAARDASDAGDASLDADASGPRCTADGWCRTDLPASDGGTLVLVDVWANQDEAWAISDQGRILHWKADAWSVAFETGAALTGVQRDHAGTTWVVGKAGKIFRHVAADPATTWTEVQSYLAMDLVGICEGTTDAQTPENLWIGGKDTLIISWTGQVQENGNPIWNYLPAGPIENRRIACAGKTTWTVGMDLTNRRSALFSNSSGTWAPIPALPTTQTLRPFAAIWASSDLDIWVANNTLIAHGPISADAPAWTTWDVGPQHFTSPMDWDMWGASSNDVWIAGRRGRIYHWDGAKLDMSATSIDGVILENNLHGISGASSSDLWVVGDDIALHRKK